VPAPERGLLARLDTLDALVADRRGLALLPDGRPAAAEARLLPWRALVGLWSWAVQRDGGRQVVGQVAGGSSVRNVGLWPRGAAPAVDHLEGVL
jgi:hypothetical protein